MGKQKNCYAYEETEQEEARYEKLHHKNQLCLGVCIVFALLTVAMVIASMQDVAAHRSLRLPIIGTGLLGLVLCGFGFRLNRQVQQYG